MDMREHESEASQSALFFALIAAVVTAASGFVGGIAMSAADADVNDTAGLGVPQLGLFAAPFAGAVVGWIRYAIVMSRRR